MSIELVDVQKAFGSNQVLKGFNLSIQEGETISVIGGLFFHFSPIKSWRISHSTYRISIRFFSR